MLLLPILYFLPIEPIEAPFIVVNVEVVDLQIHVTPKSIPLTILQIGVGVKVIMIDIGLHACEIFRTLEVMLKDTLIIEKPKLEPSTLVEFVYASNEKHVDDLTPCVEQIVVGDCFEDEISFSKGVMLNHFFTLCT